MDQARISRTLAPGLYIVVLVLSAASGWAGADELVLHQPAHYPQGFGAWTSDVSSTGSGWQVADNFRLLAGGEVTRLGWQGMYLDFQSESNNPVRSDTVSWDVTFLEDNAGRPGDILYTQTYPAAELATTSRGITRFNGVRVPVFDFAADLTTPFVAGANVPYWLSIQATSSSNTTFNPLWAWMSGSGDDGMLAHRIVPGGGIQERGQDVTFEMYGRLTGSLPSAGQLPIQLSRFDRAVQEFMQVNTIEAAVLGVMRDGEYVYQRGYGWQDELHEAPLAEDALMRIASVSKPITAATVHRLVEEGRLRLNDRVFDLGQDGGGILAIEPFGGLADERLQNVRVIDLLRHRGGWDRAVSPDYVFQDVAIANTLGISSPPTPEAKASYILGQPLDHNPGSVFAYSNVGFMMLGLVIEKVTGQDYLEVVHERIFDPLGVPRSEIAVGRTFAEDRDAREPWYDQPESWSATNVFDPQGPDVRLPDGSWDQEGAEAFGGLIASTKALLAFADQYVVSGDSIGRPRRGDEGRSWNWLHTGSLVGTNSVLWQRGDGTSFSLIFNRRSASASEYSIELGNQINDLILDPSIEWPDALVFPGDGNGDGWVTALDVASFSAALTMTSDEFTAAMPEGQLAGLDLSDDGNVDPRDLPLFYAALLRNHNPAEDLPPVVGDLNHDWQLDVTDADLLTAAIAGQIAADDVDGEPGLTLGDLDVFITDIFNTSLGDANLDGAFNSSDFVAVFQIGEYEDATSGNSTWSEGDWNADGDFTTADFVAAFQDGGYEQPAGALIRSVPEPAGWLLMSFAVVGLLGIRRTRL